ncbi:MAG: sigma 54-interacting transcriptional regulator [Eubacterium sp.]
MSSIEKNINELIIELVDFINLRHKGLLITDEQDKIIKTNERFWKIFHLKREINVETQVRKCFNDYGINKATEYFYDQDKNQVNIHYQKFGVTKDDTLGIWVFEVVNIENTRMSLLENIVEFSRDGIHAVNQDGQLIVYNEAQGKIDHYKPENVIGKHVSDVYALDYDTSLLLKVIRTQEPIESIRQGYYTTEGTFVDCVTSVIPLFYHGKIFGSAAIVRDYNGILQTLGKEKEQVDPERIKVIAKQPNYESKQTRYTFDSIITVDSELVKSIKSAKQAAQTDSNILVIGETGTGKEMFAQSIHDYSPRKERPFLAINCAAIPESLLEGLLFGTTKGAFTGATDKPGLFEEADGGTIFLDEINSMSMFLQAKLLRVLEERMVTRLGSNKAIHVSARIISSCNENPSQAIQDNILRSDLFYRLAVVYIVIPSLRMRPDDVDILTKYFIELYNYQFDKNVLDIDEEVQNLFKHYNWPGNVRQLRHLLESAMNIIEKDEPIIGIRHLPKYIMTEDQVSVTEKRTEINLENHIVTEQGHKQNIFEELKEKEKDYIIECLKKNGGNIAKTAKEMDMSRQKLYYKLKKYNLK